MASLGHPEHFRSEGALNLVHNLLGWSAPVLAGRIRAVATPLGDITRRGVRAVCLLPLLWVGAANLAFLLAPIGGVRAPASAPYAPLHPPSGHLCPPLRDVCRGGPLYLPLPPFLRVGQV
jgi:hypothetical protein